MEQDSLDQAQKEFESQPRLNASASMPQFALNGASAHAADYANAAIGPQSTLHKDSLAHNASQMLLHPKKGDNFVTENSRYGNKNRLNALAAQYESTQKLAPAA